MDEGRFIIKIVDAGKLNLQEYANELIKEYNYGNVIVEKIFVDNNEGIRLKIDNSKYILFILLLKNNKIYQISAAPLGVTNCFGYVRLEGKCLEIKE